jgi:hypothetical protein
VVPTATHGGDLKYAAIGDVVIAMHLIAPDGQEYWVERTLIRPGTVPLKLIDENELQQAGAPSPPCAETQHAKQAGGENVRRHDQHHASITDAPQIQDRNQDQDHQAQRKCVGLSAGIAEIKAPIPADMPASSA